MKTCIKTNGYEINENTFNLIQAWKQYISEKLDVDRFELFYYGENVVFADCYLTDKHYGSFVITKKSVHFNGHTCTAEEHTIFNDATYNDELCGNKLQLA